MKLFVPGRLCLFGEHSDWAGEYRNLNPQLEKGYTLIVGTNQGIYAEVKPCPDQLIVQTYCGKGIPQLSYQLPLNSQVLLAEARQGEFLSYVAGVAYQCVTSYAVGGLEINNYLTTLPIKKGLSSSAAICVLVARAFNRLYNLNLKIREEMELAYLGERTTPSHCGRMDQACAYGDRPILMIFDGDKVEVIELTVSQDLYLVIVDLGATKDTQLILNQLNQCYPLAQNLIQQNVQKYLGEISSSIIQQATTALQQGDAELLGYLMSQAQTEFDRYLIPACPSQLTAPILHGILNYELIQPYIWGGKGVGSQGDGTAQFIAKDQDSQQKVIDIITKYFPQMQCLELTITSKNKT
ncbi:MAG: GHMP kinase [Xenococcaceae cyanobacterium MO_188.B29]|nr:GHMP kinase [Xenococcaceae cyanobacterium MO_188.B29]